MHDDGVPPDSVAGDRIYARTVVFPAGEWDITKYTYWTYNQCWTPLLSAWLEDPELAAEPVLTLFNRPTTCFGLPTGVSSESDAPAGDALPFALDVRRAPAGFELVITLPRDTPTPPEGNAGAPVTRARARAARQVRAGCPRWRWTSTMSRDALSATSIAA